MPPIDDPLLPPRYQFVRRLARGGMGEIFRATDDELGREVAIKVLSGRYSGDDSLRERFRREALAAARLSGNPNIVTIFDVVEWGGRPAIVMEYLSGGSLEDRLDGRNPGTPAQVLDWLGEAASALDAAHAAGIVHRDVKPGNLLLDRAGHLHVADFGVASAAGLESFTQTGTILGTAGYLSPEQARGERATAASDRYALAVVAWELLNGTRPFESESPTAEAAAHVHAHVPAAGSPAVDHVFRRALAKDPSARHPSATAFVDDLQAALDGPEEQPTREIVRRRHPRLWPLATAAAALLAAGALTALLVDRGEGSPSPRAVTVLHTVTGEGRTVERTVTTATATAPPTQGGVALDDAGYARLQAGDYAGARLLLEQAVQRLRGTGSTAEAYADYNLAYARLAVGDCSGVLPLLDASERIQGRRPEIDRLRHDAGKRCGDEGD